MLRSCVLSLSFALLAAPPVSAAGKQETRAKIAVLDLQPQSVSKELAASATAILASELGKLGVFRVISREDIRNMLALEKEKQQLGCEADQACLAEIGGALGVEYLVAGSITRLGTSHVLSLVLNNAKTAQVENRVSETVAGDESALVAAIARSAKVLVSPVLKGREGFLLLSVAEGGAVVKIDGTIRGATPLSKLSLPWGPHLLEVEKNGFITYSEDISVPARSAVSKNVSLVPSADFINGYESSAKKLRLGAWITTGAAVAGLGGALIFNQLSASTESSFNDKRTQYQQGSADTQLLAQMQTLHNRGTTQVTLARIGVGVGALAAALATWLWIAGDDPHRYDAFHDAAPAPDKPALSATAGALPSGAAFALSGTF